MSQKKWSFFRTHKSFHSQIGLQTSNRSCMRLARYHEGSESIKVVFKIFYLISFFLCYVIAKVRLDILGASQSCLLILHKSHKLYRSLSCTSVFEIFLDHRQSLSRIAFEILWDQIFEVSSTFCGIEYGRLWVAFRRFRSKWFETLELYPKTRALWRITPSEALI